MPKKVVPASDEITLEFKPSSKIKKIKVNEKGDYITLNFADSTLPSRFISLCNELQKAEESITAAREKIANTQDMTMSDLSRHLNEIDELIIKTAGIFDGFFTEDDICEKVFGTKTPYLEDLLLFLNQFEPLFQKFLGEKVKAMNQNMSKFLDKQSARNQNI